MTWPVPMSCAAPASLNRFPPIGAPRQVIETEPSEGLHEATASAEPGAVAAASEPNQLVSRSRLPRSQSAGGLKGGLQGGGGASRLPRFQTSPNLLQVKEQAARASEEIVAPPPPSVPNMTQLAVWMKPDEPYFPEPRILAINGCSDGVQLLIQIELHSAKPQAYAAAEPEDLEPPPVEALSTTVAVSEMSLLESGSMRVEQYSVNSTAGRDSPTADDAFGAAMQLQVWG